MEKKKADWLKSIESLYNQIQKYLAGAIKEGSVKLTYKPKRIAEDYLGDYKVDEMLLQVGSERAVFSPKGLNVVGATGRIDLQGDLGTVTIIRQSGERWGVIETRLPALKIVPLNEDSLLAALKSVMRQ